MLRCDSCGASCGVLFYYGGLVCPLCLAEKFAVDHPDHAEWMWTLVLSLDGLEVGEWFRVCGRIDALKKSV